MVPTTGSTTTAPISSASPVSPLSLHQSESLHQPYQQSSQLSSPTPTTQPFKGNCGLENGHPRRRRNGGAGGKAVNAVKAVEKSKSETRNIIKSNPTDMGRMNCECPNCLELQRTGENSI